MIPTLLLLLTTATPPVYVSADPFTSPQCDAPLTGCIVRQGHGEPESVLCPVAEVYLHCQKPAP